MIAGLLALAAISIIPGGARAQALWSSVSEAAIGGTGERLIVPQRYRTVRLDTEAMRRRLDQAPLESAQDLRSSPVVLSLPLPDGSTGRFRIVESPIMAPELAAKYPEIRTYRGLGMDDRTATARLDMTPAGFHAIILAGGGTTYIDPYQRGDISHYVSYAKRDYVRAEGRRPIEIDVLRQDSPAARDVAEIVSRGLVTATGPELRTYRLAMGATGEYTQFHGGTVAGALAEINTAMNRVNGIYEREVSLRMVLVADTDMLIFTNPATDPYTNDDAFALLDENQALCDDVIGDANYDVGHVFSTGGGGLAGLAVTCISGMKAEGETGSDTPTGDPFWVDFVAHELGHQWGAAHTFNGNTGACDGNRDPLTSYEPGSGSTIAAYAGICDAQDLQPNSDDYFHTASFDQIEAHSVFGAGNCGTITATGNAAPVPNAGISGFTIPLGTPFELTGSATEPNGDAMTYCWEEYDLGPAGPPGAPVGNAPIFRSFDPVTSPTRVFPKLGDLLNNTQTIGELLPTYGRDLTFRLTVRDNLGGVAHDQMSFSVSNSDGPFLVTAPNTAVTWPGGSTQLVTWDVAGTDGAPISATNVNILLSVNGGLDFPTTLLAGTPNDGSEMIVVPSTPTALARVKVKASNSIFFDVSNQNFAITGGGGGCVIADLAAGTQSPCDPGTNTYTQEVIVSYTDPPGAGTLDVNGQSFAIGTSPQTVVLTGLNATGAPVNVTASFSAEPACTRTENGLFTSPLCAFEACITGGAIAIPDDDPSGIESDIVFTEPLLIQDVRIFVDIEHTWVGDLIVEIEHDGTVVRLHDETGDDGIDILGTYPTDLTVDGPGSLSDFDGQLAEGTWTLFVSDNASPDAGTLWDWCVEISGTPAGTDVELGGEALETVRLYPGRPNPAPGGVTQIRFALPTSQPATLRVYDLAGRLVRRLHEGPAGAGFHDVRWDGTDTGGTRVTSGIYFYRLETAATNLTRKVVVIR